MTRSNRLASASSPYLRQHAGNPVDWYPWGDEALALARAEDKPLFVSIGYAACHWCHVMAHESFEDPRTAEALARTCVSVKVDREERPDIDAVYMAAVQAATGSGGWPMSVFCTPDGRPFFAGTYFPPEDRHGMPSFQRVVDAVAAAWRERRREVEAQAAALVDAISHGASAGDRLGIGAERAKGTQRAGGGAGSAREVLERAIGELSGSFDSRDGGFGPAPKFPHPTLVELCLRHYLARHDEHARSMAETTLDAMAAGGIYDHIEGGFARYSTDARCMVPHFEKMLTDQALLARTYLRAWQVTGDPARLQVAAETIEFVCSQMTAPGGGLCASLDADAQGVEGGHATWTPDEVRAALSTGTRMHAGEDGSSARQIADEVCEWYGITERGNFEDGRSVPHRPPGAALRRPEVIERARRALVEARRHRPQPARDDKVLTEWNAMFIATLAEAGAACGSECWSTRAVALAEWLFAHNRREDGRWKRAATSDVLAFAGDYAWMLECCTRLAELTGRALWTARAVQLAGDLLDLFWDPEGGGLFTTGRDAEQLFVRAKEVLDGATPSANAIGAQGLIRLGMLTGDARWQDAGAQLVRLVGGLLDDQPLSVADMLVAQLLAETGAEIVVSGERADLVCEVRRYWLPDAVLAWGEPTGSPLWEGRAAAAAYVCRRSTCGPPASDPEPLTAQLVPLGARPHR